MRKMAYVHHVFFYCVSKDVKCTLVQYSNMSSKLGWRTVYFVIKFKEKEDGLTHGTYEKTDGMILHFLSFQRERMAD